MVNSNKENWDHSDNSVKYAIFGLVVILAAIVYVGAAYRQSWWPFDTVPAGRESNGENSMETLEINNLKVEFEGPAPQDQNSVMFATCNLEISQCDHYLLEKSKMIHYSVLKEVSIGDKFVISGNIKTLGAATGNIYHRLISDIKIKKNS